MLKAYLHPKAKPTPKHWYAYDVVFSGETIVTDSRDPDHDLARALLARGIKGKVTMHDGNTGKPRTVINIEKAAKWCADSNGKPYRWKPYERAAVRGYSPEAIVVLPTMPVDDDTAVA
jgi:hypothetical protein